MSEEMLDKEIIMDNCFKSIQAVLIENKFLSREIEIKIKSTSQTLILGTDGKIVTDIPEVRET